MLIVSGLKIVRRLGNSYAFKRYGARFYSNPFPPCAKHAPDSDGYWTCYVRYLATTDHHPVGTCKMGPVDDPGSVLDHRFRVRGVSGLRVVDASAMPTVVSGNINIPIVMMAERAADFIKEEYYNAIR